MPDPANPGTLRKAADFLGLKKSIVGLLAMVVMVGMGEHMAEQFLPLYLVVLGGGILSAGALNGMDNLLGALYSYPGGYLADRLGNKRALLIFNLIAIFGFALVLVIPKWQAVLLGAVFFLSWTAISLPATMGLVARALPRNKRTMGVSVHSLVRRIPMSLGPIIGGALIGIWGVALGVRLAFAGALVMALVALVIQQKLIEDDRPDGVAARDAASKIGVVALFKDMGPGLRSLLVSDILVRFCEQIPYAFVVLYCVRLPEGAITLQQIAHPISALQFGVLRSIEMATAILIYIPVAYQADRLGKKPFVVMTFVFFSVFPLALLFAKSFWWLVPVFVLRGLKEFGEPSRKALIMDLAPEDRKAAMFGLYYLIRDIIVSVAAFGGAFLWMASPRLNLLTAFAFGVFGTIWFALKGRALPGSGDIGKPAEVNNAGAATD
jgi:MFS family permease